MLRRATMAWFFTVSLLLVKGAVGEADLMLSGHTCYGGVFNGVWAYQENTADGKRYYSHTVQGATLYLFYDKDVDGTSLRFYKAGFEMDAIIKAAEGKTLSAGGLNMGDVRAILVANDESDEGTSGECRARLEGLLSRERCKNNVNQWYLSKSKLGAPSTTALQDLDGDRSCYINGHTVNQDTSGSPTPPTNALWRVGCESGATLITLSLTPICDSTDYTYTYPEQWTTFNAGCGTGIARVRTEVEACPARDGCDCSNKRVLETETVKQTACPSTTTGKPADLMMSGQPYSCAYGFLNGAWDYQENTADGKRYYKKRDIRFGNYYLYFDMDADGGADQSQCSSYANEWIIGEVIPRTTRLVFEDLDQDGQCFRVGWTDNQDTSGSATPPTSAQWRVSHLKCQTTPMPMTFSFAPIICDTPPAYRYAYPEKWTAVNVGCGNGIARVRTEVESCSAPGRCDCTNRRTPNFEREGQIKCSTSTKPTTTDRGIIWWRGVEFCRFTTRAARLAEMCLHT